MPICEPMIRVECDKCGEITDEMELTSLAGGGWDDRNIKRRLLREGYRVTGDETVCPECIAQEEEAAA